MVLLSQPAHTPSALAVGSNECVLAARTGDTGSSTSSTREHRRSFAWPRIGEKLGAFTSFYATARLSLSLSLFPLRSISKRYTPPWSLPKRRKQRHGAVVGTFLRPAPLVLSREELPPALAAPSPAPRLHLVVHTVSEQMLSYKLLKRGPTTHTR